MSFIVLLAIFAIISCPVFCKDEVEVGVVFESGCPGAREFMTTRLIPQYKLLSKDGNFALFFIN